MSRTRASRPAMARFIAGSGRPQHAPPRDGGGAEQDEDGEQVQSEIDWGHRERVEELQQEGGERGRAEPAEQGNRRRMNLRVLIISVVAVVLAFALVFFFFSMMPAGNVIQ